MRSIVLANNVVVLVSSEDYEFLIRWKWKTDKHGYAIRTAHRAYVNGKQKHKTIRMHRVVADRFLNPSGNLNLVDHINRNRLDNRRENLRLCTKADNQRNIAVPSHNTSGFVGVSWNKPLNKWESYITMNHQKIHIGVFEDIYEAAQARACVAEQLHGEFTPR